MCLIVAALGTVGLLMGCEKQRVTTAPAGDAEVKVLAAWNFDEVPEGQPPERFAARQNNPSTELATWKVMAAPHAATPPHVMAVQSRNENPTFNLLLAEGTSFKDLDATVKVRGQSGEHDRGGGILWRGQDENNYYVCRMNPLETNFRVYKIVDGKRKQLASAEGVQTESDRWHEVRATMVGDHIQCYLDGQRLLDIHDSEFDKPGMVGLWTKADASSSFDDFVVCEPSSQAVATQPE